MIPPPPDLLTHGCQWISIGKIFPKINRPGIESLDSNIDGKIGKKKTSLFGTSLWMKTPAFKSKQKAENFDI